MWPVMPGMPSSGSQFWLGMGGWVANKHFSTRFTVIFLISFSSFLFGESLKPRGGEGVHVMTPYSDEIARTGEDGAGSRQGVVKWFSFSRGYGFITDTQSGEEYFVHQVSGSGSSHSTVKSVTFLVDHPIIQSKHSPILLWRAFVVCVLVSRWSFMWRTPMVESKPST